MIGYQMLIRIPSHATIRWIHVSSSVRQAMPAGTQIEGFDFLKTSEPLVAKPREEYPEWVNTLAQPMKSLPELRKMEFEDATDKERMRFLVLTRRQVIKENNLEGN